MNKKKYTVPQITVVRVEPQGAMMSESSDPGPWADSKNTSSDNGLWNYDEEDSGSDATDDWAEYRKGNTVW